MKVILFGSVILLNLVCVLLAFVLGMSDSILAILLVNLIISAVIQSVLSFHIWNAIHDGRSPINPYLAAGLHFIPVLGSIWTLISFAMYPTAFVNYTKRRNEEDKNFSVIGLDAAPFNHFVIFTLVSIVFLMIPVINFLVPVVSLLLYLRVIATACGGVEDLRFSESYADSIKTNVPMPTAKNSLSIAG